MAKAPRLNISNITHLCSDQKIHPTHFEISNKVAQIERSIYELIGNIMKTETTKRSEFYNEGKGFPIPKSKTRS